MRHVPDDERRARLARRHAVAPGTRLPDPVAATRAMTVLHATEPATVYLALLARVDGLRQEDVDRALFEDRSLVKQLAMRRTLFVFPRDLLPAAWGSVSARVAEQQWKRLVKDVERGGVAEDGTSWLRTACAAVLERLADGSELTAQQLREEVAEVAGRVEVSPDKSYGGSFPIAPRVLTQLAVEGRIVRGRNNGHWRTSRPRWTLMERWLGESPAPRPGRVGWCELVTGWLRTFGPGTAADVQWWLGATAGVVRQALADAEAVQVSLDGGDTGWLLPDDLASEAQPAAWAALLPVLDPTVMGWKGRDFFLNGHGPEIFDRNGNAGTTAWWAGRVVGCWVQDQTGEVRVHLLEEVDRAGRAALQVEARRLTAWLDGTRVGTVYPSPAMKAATADLGG